jgi:gamma-glutamylcyclotransferase (GGCT)/AIG2-like uncharacterized protein YtfP
MSSHVFTYGSLMFAKVWTRVVIGRYRSLAATLDGHARFAVVEQTYPGMIVAPGESVVGVIYLDVTDDDLDRLDHFEGEDYRRATVTVESEDGVARPCETYVYLLDDRLLASPWDPNAFALQRFLDTYVRDRLE